MLLYIYKYKTIYLYHSINSDVTFNDNTKKVECKYVVRKFLEIQMPVNIFRKQVKESANSTFLGAIFYS